jgi:hypothetical protein
MDYGIQIYMPALNSMSIDKGKNLMTVGGGINSKKLSDALWTAGKQAGKSILNIVLVRPVSYPSTSHRNL